ncbi:cupin domain-containing protein [Mycoplasmatota bacterium]|nr:cupin domain-containing protein [Mycoplasmatota bacterium]
MQHYNLKDIKTEINIRGIKAKTMVDHKNATIKNLMLGKGESIPNHQVPVDVTFFILEGQGQISIGDAKYNVKVNDIVTCPPNTLMSVKADDDSPLSFINIKTPGIKVTK